jgi:hypothetical protein
LVDCTQKPDRSNSWARLDLGEADEGRTKFAACISPLRCDGLPLLAKLFVKLALLAILVLSIYSVGATFFAAWQRNNLPTLANFQKAGIWLTIVSLFLWAYVLFRAGLNIVGGVAFMPVTVANDPVIQFGNQVLYSRLSRHLENLKPGDYVLVDTTGARELNPITQRLGEFYNPVRVVFSPSTIGRIEAVRQSESGTELVISVPLIFGSQTIHEKVLVPINAVQGKIIAILNPPSCRRWLP